MSDSFYTVYSDGGARGNPGPAAIGVLICDPEGREIHEHKAVLGIATNNVAEYTAVINGLRLAREMGAVNVDYYMDSELVCKQLNGQYRVKAPHIRELYLQAREQAGKLEKVRFNHVRRTHEKLRHVDGLVNEALDDAERNPDLYPELAPPGRAKRGQGQFDF